MNTFRPGDLVRLKTFDEGSIARMLTSETGALIGGTNRNLGNLEYDSISIVINHDEDEEETLILTSTGTMGWIRSMSMMLVARVKGNR